MLLRTTDSPIIAPDEAWERGAALFAVATLTDELSGELLLYYAARFPDSPLKNVLCLARSRDGISWEKPDCGDGTNIVMRGSGNTTGWGEFIPTTILRDTGEDDPAHRWKMVYWDRPDTALPPGVCLATSSDGLTWTPRLNRPIITNANDAMSLIDTIPGVPMPLGRGRYVIYQQTWKFNPALPTDRDNLKGMHRRISIWTSGRFAEGWVGPVTILEPDERDDDDLQFYWLTPFKTRDGAYGGFLNCHHTTDQTMDVQLVSSRDGWSWTRENDRTPILPLGPRGQFDCGLIVVAAPPVRWSGRVLVFYNGRPTVHDGQPRFAATGVSDPVGGIGVAEFTDDLLQIGRERDSAIRAR
ncbi:MAG: hypothetical protein O3A51_08150 [Verrucomicrobia bacterium]|nr:hypothetical protein [Verrucomicrobiota bacterium]